MQVTETIYGPGAYRRARVLLAVPGMDYPEDYVLAITGGDRSKIVTDVADDPLAAAILDAFDETPAATTEEVAAAAFVDDGGETFDELTKAELLELAAERGIEVKKSATKLQLIGALTAAADEPPAEEG